MKTRKDLPSFGVLGNLRFDTDQIRQHCEAEGLLQFEKYDDIKVSSGSKHAAFVRANAYNKSSFFTEDGAERLEGDLYRQIYLTDLTEEYRDAVPRQESGMSPGRRLARLDRTSPHYDPVADELNYTQRNSLVKGPFEEILNSFKAKVTRVRLAYLAPGFAIKPHVDYDPSYISRFHLPILTSEECSMNVIRDGFHEQARFPSDGRVYFFNAGLKHWAANDSARPRLHLIIDVHGQDDLEFLQPLAPYSREPHGTGAE